MPIVISFFKTSCQVPPLTILAISYSTLSKSSSIITLNFLFNSLSLKDSVVSLLRDAVDTAKMHVAERAAQKATKAKAPKIEKNPKVIPDE